MSDSKFEYPNANEKLSHKFILDGLRERVLEKESQLEIPTNLEVTLTAEIEEVQCGSEAPPITLDETYPSPQVPLQELLLPEGKKYFRIGEVSQLIGVEPYVLRYWESEFAIIKPVKSGSGHRVYSRKDVEALNTIRHLLHVERFSIKGAKKKLLEKRKDSKDQIQRAEPNRKVLKDLVNEIKDLIQLAKSPV